MSLLIAFAACALTGFPRVSGDEPLEATFGPKIETFSPRERG